MIKSSYFVFSVLLFASYAEAQFSLPEQCYEMPGFSTCYKPALDISESCQMETDYVCYCFSLKLMDTCAKKYCANVSRTKFNIPDIDQEKCLNGKGDDKPSEEPPVKSDVPPEATTPDTDKGKSDDEPSEEPLVTSDVPAEATALDTDKGKGDDEQSEEPLVPSDVPPNSTTLATCKGKARASMGFSNGTSVIIPSPANITNPRPTTPPFGAPISNLITATTPTVRPATQSAPTASPSPNAVGPTAALCGGGSIAIVAVMLAAAAAGALL